MAGIYKSGSFLVRRRPLEQIDSRKLSLGGKRHKRSQITVQPGVALSGQTGSSAGNTGPLVTPAVAVPCDISTRGQLSLRRTLRRTQSTTGVPPEADGPPAPGGLSLVPSEDGGPPAPGGLRMAVLQRQEDSQSRGGVPPEADGPPAPGGLRMAVLQRQEDSQSRGGVPPEADGPPAPGGLSVYNGCSS